MRTTLFHVLPLLLVATACSDQTFTVDVPFRVTSVSPSPEAAGVSRNAELVVTFSEELDAATVANAESFKVEVINGDLSTTVSGTYKYGPAGDAPFAVSFKPTRPFAWVSTVRITLTSAIKRKRDGAPLPTPMTFEFRTETPPPLGITRITPHDGTSTFERTGQVRVTFTEPVDCRAFETTNGPVSFTETRNAHPHWALLTGATRLVPGSWNCPTMDANDPLVTDGVCRSSNGADPVDYCTVTFDWAALDQADPALAVAMALAPSSTFELNLKGIDVASQLSEVVHSRRAVQRTGEVGIEIHGALAASVNVKGSTAAPPPLAITNARLEQPTPGTGAPGRQAVLHVGFSERVDCDTLDAVTVTEEFDPQVAARRGATQRDITGTWSCEGEALDPGDHTCPASGGCSYVFTPEASDGELFAFDWSSLVHVVLDGGAQGNVVESVRATTNGGQLPDATSYTFALVDPPVFTLVGSSPADGASGVGRASALVVAFSEPPDCDALAAGVTITEIPAVGAPVDVIGSWACTPAGTETLANPDAAFACPAGGCAATFTPGAPFGASSKVTVSLGGGAWTSSSNLVSSSRATSRAGNLAGRVNIEFQVEDPLPYFVTATSPGDAATGVSAATPVTLRFVRGVDCSSLELCDGTNASTCTLSVEEVADPLIGNTPLDGTGRARDFVTGTLTCLDGGTDVTLLPDTPLSPSSDVAVSVAGSATGAAVRAADGASMASPHGLGFSVADPPQLMVTSSTPVAGATGVAANTALSVSFTHALDCDTVDETNVRVEVASDQAGPYSTLAGVIGCSNTTATFTPAAPLTGAQWVKLTVGTGDVATSVRGLVATTRGGFLAAPVTIGFQVAEPSVFHVTTTSPADGASGVTAATALTLHFSDGLDCNSIELCTGANAATCTLSVEEVADPLIGNTPLDGTNRARDFVTGTLTCLDGDTNVILIPDAALSPSSTVEVTVAAGATVRADDGWSTLTPFNLAFSVADPPQLLVTSSVPGTGATGVAADTDLSVSFTHALDCDTVDATNVRAEVANDEAGPYSTLAGVPGCSNASVTFTPVAPLGNSQWVKLTVGTSDVATSVRGLVATTRGGILAAPVTIGFQVADPSLFYVTTTTPADGASGVSASTALTMNFSNGLDCASLVVCNGANAATCTVSVLATPDPLTGGPAAPVPGTVTCGTSSVTFTPTNPFAVSSSVVVRLEGSESGPAIAANTQEGGKLLSDFVFGFSVADPQPLVVVATTPAGATTGVDAAAPISITFSHALDCDTVDASTVTVQATAPARSDGTPESAFLALAGTLNCAGAGITFTPTVAPAASARVKVSVGTATADTSVRATTASSRGGYLAGPVEFEYRVADPQPLVLVASKPANDPTVYVSDTTDVQFTFDRAVICSSALSRVSLRNASQDLNVPGTVTCVGALVKFSPTNPLTVGDSYEAVATAGVEATDATVVGAAGYGVLAQAVTVSFEVGEEPLAVTAHSPAGGATGVLVGSELSLTFNQALEQSSIIPCTAAGVPANCNLSVNRGTSYSGPAIITTTAGVHGALTLNFDLADGASAPNLAQSQAYYVRLRGGTTGPLGLNGLSRLPAEYSFAFTTAADATVVSTTPVHQAANVATTSDLCLEFSRPVDAASLTAGGTNQITVSWATPTGYTALVPLEATPYTVSGTQVCLNVDEALVPGVAGEHRLLHGTNYTVNVSTQVVVGVVALSSPYSYTFTTALPPALSGASIANAVINEALTDGKADVPVNTRFVVRFTETMDPATLSGTTVWLQGESNAWSTSFEFDDTNAPRTVTLTPTTPLLHKHEYILTLVGGLGGLKTLAGEPLDNDVAFRFTTSPATSLVFAPTNDEFSTGVTVAFIASRALEPASATPVSVYGFHDATRLAGLVGTSGDQLDTVLFTPHPPLLPSQMAKYTFGVNSELLDERGNPVEPSMRGAISTNAATPTAPVALTCTGGNCAVAPAPGTMPDGRPTWTLSFVDGTLPQRMLPNTVYGSTSSGPGSISLVASGSGLGCPTSGTFVPVDVTFTPGSTSEDEVTITPASPWLKAGCTYNLRVDQTQLANVFNIPANTTVCNGVGGPDTIPTDVLSDAKCESGDPSPGLTFTGESTAPTLMALEGFTNAGSFKTLAGANDIAAHSTLRANLSEAVDPASVTNVTFAVSPSVSGTFSINESTITFVPSAPLQALTPYTVTLEGLTDLAGNPLPTATASFLVETDSASLDSVDVQLPARGRPFGYVRVGFTERIKASTLVADTFTGATVTTAGSVSLVDGSGPLPGTFVMETALPMHGIFIPARAMSGSVSATVNASFVLTDLAGTPVTPGTKP